MGKARGSRVAPGQVIRVTPAGVSILLTALDGLEECIISLERDADDMLKLFSPNDWNGC